MKHRNKNYYESERLTDGVLEHKQMRSKMSVLVVEEIAAYISDQGNHLLGICGEQHIAAHSRIETKTTHFAMPRQMLLMLDNTKPNPM